MIKKTIILLFAICALSGCHRDTVKKMAEVPEENAVKYATHFALIKQGSNTVIRILNPWQGSESVSMEYYLVKRGSAMPAGLDSVSVIFTPLRKVICMSVTHIAMISELGELGSVSAVSGKNLVYSPDLLRRMKTEYIPDVGYEAGLNNELIVKTAPEIVFMYGIGGESAGYTKKIEEMGVRVLFVGDYLETDPLARAEWIKLFGALYLRESMADSIFNQEMNSYNDICKTTASVTIRPEVLLGLPYKDTWYISPGDSYISKLIADAGGEYLWSQTRSRESMPVGLENVFMKALAADYWLNTGTASSRKDIVSIDPRFSELPCYKKGNIYNNINRLNENGGNDYWEAGSVHPHMILKDLAIILHPELFSNDSLHFYKKLE